MTNLLVFQPARFGRVFIDLLALMAVLPVFAYAVLRHTSRPPSLIQALGLALPWLTVPLLAVLSLALLVHSRLGLFLIGAVLSAFLVGYGPRFIPHRIARAAGPSFTVMTYNTLYTTRNAAPVVEQVNAFNPDIVALQEFYPPKNAAVAAELSKIYPYSNWDKGYALFSRYPLRDCSVQRASWDVSGWVQRCRTEINGQAVTLYNVHLRPPYAVRSRLPLVNETTYTGMDWSRREGDLQVVMDFIGDEQGPQIVLGDFNMADSEPPYASLRKRWQDAFREAGWGMGFTFHRPEFPFPLWRIDYVFHTPDMMAQSARLGWFSESDHRPVIAVLGFK